MNEHAAAFCAPLTVAAELYRIDSFGSLIDLHHVCVHPHIFPAATGLIKGKINYMAPEQARGEALGGAADVFALGLSLQAMVHVDAPGDSSLRAAVAGRLPQIEGFDEDVLELLQACLSPDPENRPSAGDVARWAGSLAARRSEGDLRGALVDWLASMSADRKVSKLDQLMNLVLVPVPGTQRQFTVSTRGRSDVLGSDRQPAGQRRWRQVGLALLVGLALFGVVWATITRPTSTDPPVTAPQTESSPVASIETTVAPTPLVASPTIAPTVTSTNGALPATEAPAAERAGRSAQPTLMQRRRTPPTNTARQGWLRVGGGALRGARVEVDGASRGFAPWVGQLRQGEHEVRILDSEQVLLAQTRVHITEAHTRTAPATFLRR